MDDDELDAAIARSLATQAAAGVTTVRDLGDRHYRTLLARDRRSPGEPRIVAAGPPLTVPGVTATTSAAPSAGSTTSGPPCASTWTVEST